MAVALAGFQILYIAADGLATFLFYSTLGGDVEANSTLSMYSGPVPLTGITSFISPDRAIKVLLDIAVILYLLLSVRVRRTFAYGREGDALALPLKRIPEDSADVPLPLYGLAIIPAMFAAYFLRFCYVPLLSYLGSISVHTFPILGILINAAGAAVSLWCFVLLFRRKKLFKWVFIGLSGAYAAFMIITGVIHNLEGYASASLEGGADLLRYSLISIFQNAVIFLFFAGIVVYMLLSKRIKRTFVYKAEFSFPWLKSLLRRFRTWFVVKV